MQHTVHASSHAVRFNARWLQFIYHCGMLLGYLCLSIALTWPLVAHWDTGVVGGLIVDQPASSDYNPRFEYGGFEDASQNVWNMWWTRWALEHRQNPYWSSLLYYPQGVQLYMQTLNLPATLLAQPVHYLAGPIAAYNASVLLACTLTGYAGFLLVRAFVPGTAIPFLCGALLTASPFHVMKLQSNQLNLISMQWLPLFVLALFWLNQERGVRSWEIGDERLQRPRITRQIVFASGVFVLAALTDWYWGLICGIYAVLWFAISLARARRRWQLLRHYLLFGGGVLLGLAPIFVGIASVGEAAWPASARLSTWQGYIQGYSADALGLFFPSPFHPLWGAQTRAVLDPMSAGYAPDGWFVAAGWVLLGWAGLGVWWSWREQWHLLVIGGVVWVLSLGPTLGVAGVDTGITLPYALFEQMPLMGMARRPSHFAVLCIVLALIFAGIGLHHVRQRLPPRWQAGFVLAVGALAVGELWPPPRQVFTFDQPAIFTQIANRPGPVADLPLEWQETSRSLRHQMIHEQPILGGYLARRPEYPTRRYIPTLNWITETQDWPDIIPLHHDALAAMQCYYPIRHAVAHKDLMSAADVHRLAEIVATINGGPLPPTFEDDRHVWYELPLFAERCVPFVYLGAGWHQREHTEVDQWRWASSRSDIWAVNPFESSIVATLKLDMEAYESRAPSNSGETNTWWEAGK